MALDNSIFKKPAAAPEYRLSVNSEGLERTGKTRFALTAPAPLGILALDRNTMNMAIKAQKVGKEVHVADFVDANVKTNPLAKWVIPQREEAGKPLAKQEAADRKFYEGRWEAIGDAYYKLVKESSIRTIILDTASQAYDDIRLARFGKVAGVMARDYGPIFAELRDMILAAKCNLFAVHRLAPNYIKNEWDGKSYKAKGYSGAAFDCQLTLRHESALITDPEDKTKKKPFYKATIMNCSDDGSLMGLELSDDDCNFQTLAQIIHPDAPDGVWE